MCGLVGVAGNLSTNDADKFLHMLKADVVRGEHATGVTKVSTGGVVDHFKLAYDANVFLQLTPAKNFLSRPISNTVLMGHNRHATKGASDAHENAHPFKHGHITLMHNGSLTSWHNVTPTTERYTVDSEAICRGFEYYGVEETIKKLNGAFALTWYDEKLKTINFVRNSQRDLALAINKKANKVYWASEKGMLKWILDRKYFGLQATDYDEMFELKEGVWLSIPVKGINLEVDKMEVKDVELRSVYQAPKTNTSTGGNTTTSTRTDRDYSKDAKQTLEAAGKRNQSIRKLVEDCDERQVFLDERIAVYYTDYVPYGGNSVTGKIVGQMVEWPYLEVEMHNMTKTDRDRLIANTGGLFTSFLSQIYENSGGAGIYIMVKNQTWRKIHNLDIYEFSWENVPEFPQVSEELAQHYVGRLADADLEPMEEEQEVVSEVSELKLSDDSIATVGGTVMYNGSTHVKVKVGNRYTIERIEKWPSGRYLIGVLVDTSLFLIHADNWSRAENIEKLPSPDGVVPKTSGSN